MRSEVSIVAFDGEDLAQKRFESLVLSLGNLDILLEESLVSDLLDLDEVGDRERVAALGKIADLGGTHGHILFKRQTKDVLLSC